MKKTILAFGIIAATLFSCDKDDPAELIVTDLTGTTVLSGTITRPDNTSTPSGRVPVEGATVTVRVANSSLFPNSNSAQGSRTYTRNTDANGNYSIPVTTNGDGVAASVTYSPVTILVDPVGGFNEIFAPNFGGVNRIVQKNDLVNNDFSVDLTLVSDVPTTYNVTYTIDETVDVSDLIVDSATVRGSVDIQHFVEDTTAAGNDTIIVEDFALENVLVTLIFNEDPTTRQERVYTTTTDVDGNYSFTVQTADAAHNLDQNYEIFIPDFNSTQDTVEFGDDFEDRNTGDAGVFSGSTINSLNPLNPLNPNDIDNAKNFTYENFIKD